MKKSTKIILFGTPEFAVPTLKLLHQEGVNIVLVITQPDKPAGRKRILTPSPVKVEAERLGLTVFQELPKSVHLIQKLKLDIGIAAAYGEFISADILSLFPKGCLNIHPSLLPKYRGPSPIQAAILNGDKTTGVSIIKLDEKMDHGDVIQNSKLKIQNSDTYQTLYQKLAEVGADLLIKTLPLYLEGKIRPKSQNDSKATYTKLIKKVDGKIDWLKSAAEIKRQIRAYIPWPGSYSELRIRNKELRIKIEQVRVYSKNFSVKPGNFCQENNQLFIQCGKSSLLIEKLQPEGKKIMSGQEFINGYLK